MVRSLLDGGAWTKRRSGFVQDRYVGGDFAVRQKGGVRAPATEARAAVGAFPRGCRDEQRPVFPANHNVTMGIVRPRPLRQSSIRPPAVGSFGAKRRAQSRGTSYRLGATLSRTVGSRADTACKTFGRGGCCGVVFPLSGTHLPAKERDRFEDYCRTSETFLWARSSVISSPLRPLLRPFTLRLRRLSPPRRTLHQVESDDP